MKKKDTLQTQSSSSDNRLSFLKSCNLSELSISEIHEQKPNFDSLDFQHERDLITQIIQNSESTVHEYGLSFRNKKPESKKVNENRIRGWNGELGNLENIKIQNTDSQLMGQELQVDEGLKDRKQLKKQKMGQNFQLTGIGRCKEKIADAEKTTQNYHQYHQCKIMASPPIVMKGPLKQDKIMTSLFEKPLKSRFKNGEEILTKLYHSRADQFKQQVNDININLNLMHFPNEKMSPKNKLTNSVSNRYESKEKNSNLKRSMNDNIMREKYRYQPTQRRHMPENSYFQIKNGLSRMQVIEVRRPTSQQCRIKGIKNEYNYSRDSSTSTHKTVKKVYPILPAKIKT